MTAAEYKNQLLSGKLSDNEDVNDNNAIILISTGRLKELLREEKYDTCGEQAQTSIINKYFNCTMNVRCNKCVF